MKPMLISLDKHADLCKAVAKQMDAEIGQIEIRNFPDQETYFRLDSNVKGKDVVIVNSLDQPNDKIIPLILANKTIKMQGARTISLCAPYLAYMRQDKAFKQGESISAKYFAELISQYFDGLVTMDPHLHRFDSLGEIYTIKNRLVHAAPCISSWVKLHVENPVFIGPDSESKQWISDIADMSKAPYMVLDKVRLGDSYVQVSQPELACFKHHTPVLVDDIISTASTMIATVQHLQNAQLAKPVCIGVHAIFAGDSYQKLKREQVANVVTCNTVFHTSNAIDISEQLALSLQSMVK